jgi:predicted metal-dependent hydrolase
MKAMRYLAHYPEELQAQVRRLIDSDKLGEFLLEKYPCAHTRSTDRALHDYAALGLHTRISKVHGGKLKARREIRIASLFKRVPEPFLNMIVAHELAHLKEREHNKAFYQLCEHMAPGYHQLEFDLRLYLVHLERFGKLY